MKIEVTEEFIKEAEAMACPDWKIKIRNLAPELFKQKFEINKWYKNVRGAIVNYQNGKSGYGVSSKKTWYNNDGWRFDIFSNSWKTATEKEVKDMLVKEAKKRGLVIGVSFDSLQVKYYHSSKNAYIDCYMFSEHTNVLYSTYGVLFHKGEWAKPKENLILKRIEEIENELKQLKQKL